MKLVSFQIRNFRSINDSGSINVAKVTTLVGRNESGKTNLLLALHSLNPPGGPKDLSAIKDFPRQRRMSECTPQTPVVDTLWKLDGAEQAKLAELVPRAKGVTRVEIGRPYRASHRWVGFKELTPFSFDHSNVVAKFQALGAALKSAAEKLEAGPKSTLEAALTNATEAVLQKNNPDDWAAAAQPVLAVLRQAISSTGLRWLLGVRKAKLRLISRG